MRRDGLSKATIRAHAGSTSFARGEDYVRYVQGLRITDSGASASIQAHIVYLVDLQWSPRSLIGHCTCPHHASGHFCKHLVAIGLTVLDSGERRQPETRTAKPDPLDQLAAAALRDDPASSELMLELVNGALRVRGFVDYRRSFDVAAEVQHVLDELEAQLDGGNSRVVQAPLLRAVTRSQRIIERVDDSAGVLGDACQRAVEIYARACRAGHPEPTKLARWLVNFRDTSPGWPQIELADFVAAFDDKALRSYRRAVARLEEKYAGADTFARFELDRMRLELADHDNDVDRAVAILSEGEPARYAAIVDRLRAAGRDAEASAWIDEGVSAGRVSGGFGDQHRDFWLTPGEVAEDLLGRGREDDAIAVLRTASYRATDIRPYRALLEFADRLGRREEEEKLALLQLRERARMPYENGALLVQIALADKDLDRAWEVAEEFGAGHAWQTLANASTRRFPGKAARMHRARVDESLKVTDSSRYREISASLVRIRELTESAGGHEEFATYLAGIRQTYRRRPSLMAALDRRGLP